MKRWYVLGFAAGLVAVGAWLVWIPARDASAPSANPVSVDEGEAPAGPAPAAPMPAAPVPVPAPPKPAPPPAAPPADPYTLSTEILLEFVGDGAAFTPGQPADITVLMEYSGDGPVTALGLMQDLPPGWAYQEAVGGDRPVVAPKPGTRGEITFAWIQPPVFPFVFTFRAVPDAAASAPAALRAQAVFRKTGGELRSAPAEAMMQPAAAAAPPAETAPAG
ncbi:MAG: hypothetical protein GXY15_10110 [Candidatus Hydrogenedentes bacterium]|nr:hypothetical protein [Candidatus Hydrogenedentota bacterium]